MDLRETLAATGNRHPWELARVDALRAIVQAHGLLQPGGKTLDLGCGDGFLIEALCADAGAVIDAVDIHLTSEQIRGFAGERPRLRFHNDYRALPDKAYGLLTLFDVLEHIADDVGYLREITARFAEPGAFVFCTVPAFQALFCAHDVYLHHQRRYSRSGLQQVLGRAGLTVIASGYLFASLLPVRALVVLAEKCFGVSEAAPGIGQWRRGRVVTSGIKALLAADNHLLLWLSRIGITVPGLTTWALCETSR